MLTFVLLFALRQVDREHARSQGLVSDTDQVRIASTQLPHHIASDTP